MGDLRIRDLVVEYSSGHETVRPVDGLDLDVAAGSLAILLGPSGCGKTTLLSCIGGILKPTAGRILAGNIDVTALNAHSLTVYRRNTVGIVFQAFNLVPSLTAAENVMVPMRAAGMSRRAAGKRAAELLDRVGLTERMNHRPGDLSGGQQQRVAVARALVTKPAVLFADEPTGNLDSKASEDVLQMLRGAVDEVGQTVIMVTHEPDAAAHGDRLIALRDGKLVHDAPPVSADNVIELLKTLG